MSNTVKLLALIALAVWGSSCAQPTRLPADHQPRIVAPDQPRPFVKAPKKLIGIFVDAKSTAAAPDGKSWANAYNNIQDAVLAAEGQIIYVAAGTYKNPKIVIQDIPVLTLVAGYQAGDVWEKDLSSLSPQDDVVLDANSVAGESLISISGSSKAIMLRGPLVFENTLDASAVRIVGTAANPLSDITIANARFENNRHSAGGYGPGIFIEHAQDIKLNNINAKNNTSTGNGGFIYADHIDKLIVNGGIWDTNTATALGKGGALYAENSQRLSIKPNLIKDSSATNGGAIYLSQVSNSEIGGVSLDNNSATANGGAVYLDQVTDTTLNLGNAEIKGNKAKLGGAVYMLSGQHVDLRGGKFMANQATSMGGAIYDKKGINTRILDSVFDDNQAKSGGTFYFDALSKGLSIDGVKVSGSKATNGHGGALHVFNQRNSLAVINITNAEFENNTATKNGGAAMFKNIKGTVTFKNTKFNTNTADGFGGALALDARTQLSARYIIDEGTTFRGNSSKKNAGGGAILAVFDPIHAPAIRLDFRTIIALDDSITNTSANTNGYFLMVTSLDVYAIPLSGERAGGAVKKISDVLFPQLVDFNRTGLTIDEGKNVYQY